MRILVLGVLLIGINACDTSARKFPGNAAVASADPLATAAGMEVLALGGNAFDAAVAVAGALGVVEPAASGLGGGGFFLLYLAKTDEYRFVDAREVAPAAATRNMFLDDDGKPRKRASMDGPLAAGIPGEPAGLAYLSENFGTLPLSVTLAPAIRYAEEGFNISPRALLGLRFRKKSLLDSPAFATVFYPAGELPTEGDLIIQPDLANTYKRFAESGNDGFYKGETARLLVDGVRDAGGIWSLEDLATYAVVEREPTVFEYNGMRVVSAPPPSSGGVALAQMFKFLSAYPLDSLPVAQQVHYEIEAMRLAYRDRAVYMGDPDFVAMPLDRLLGEDYLQVHRQKVVSNQALASSSLEGIDTDGSEGRQTTHFSVLDKAGNRVSATITVNTWYGAGFIAPGTGVVLNNEMDDFSIKKGVPNEFGLIGDEANSIAAAKRPLSSMSPSFLESDRGIAIVGTPGGSRIITMVLQAALAWERGADAEEMVSQKRFHHQYLPDVVNYEPGAIDVADIELLQAMGHKLSESRRPFGNMNVVTWDYATNKVSSVTDPRGEGEGRVY
ncbi:MAG: gamma-glutamyltransferase [Gammaproteobacteria bacterium]|nr:gamma-glutamyltransferase [Gammaproteobacteria bacterium]MCP4275012.1 gamma-glutamyltransferase [Gammaproteobacteria bacterium]MCP4831835.1 gamma-glutamyltransferase [Gammaproteobacteria bacterium]MCP4929771.1 gamma-glutamyltransferase [Gammaproteobacteria bacterium]